MIIKIGSLFKEKKFEIDVLILVSKDLLILYKYGVMWF